ncbi:bile acid:sodium symporter family protein [Denitromonas halophila]|uniref:Bile acid:sodium symporter n=1 Tax=Denitromonas halophila TaxID=1629404 RepID=A0A557QVX0_9RHOO|nr:bile acid:sodium symporter family protein [Denitromonas halophila]TVO57057.1 bile acid:sodium symporter [Denitromonas halophila]
MLFLRRLFDPFSIAVIVAVLIATLLPAVGRGATVFGGLTHLAIALLFFLHGARLSRAAILAGAGHWRLHALVFACTFVLFPLLVLALKPLILPLVGETLYRGMIYLSVLPATVQSAIAFTSMARGNVPAAICSAAASSLLGIVLTPLLVMVLMDAGDGSGSGLGAVGKIVLQLLVPFLAGHAARHWIGAWVARHQRWLKFIDQGSILLVVYTAFSDAVTGGLWQLVPAADLLALALVCCLLLAMVLWITQLLALRLGFSTEDCITIVFAGSKKSMATGVPMAQILFAGGAVGPLILPLMIFHQIQLMVCAALAQHYAQRDEAPLSAADTA